MPNKKFAVFLLGGLAIWLVVYHVYGYFGHYGFDDMDYAYYAAQWANGNVLLNNDMFAYRWAIIVPTAISYALFGINDTASSIYPLAITLATGCLLLYVASQFGKLAMFFTTIVWALNHWTLFYADKIMPDIIQAFGILAAFVIYCQYRFSNSPDAKTPAPDKPQRKLNLLWYQLGFAFALFFAFLAKETVFVITPFLLYLLVVDGFAGNKHMRHFWLGSILAGSVILLTYLLLIGSLTGNWLMRFDAIAQNMYYNPNYTENLQPLMQRITYGLILLFIQQGMAISMGLALPLVWPQCKLYLMLKMPTQQSFWAIVFVGLFMSAYFTTTSFTNYMPMRTDPRHYLFLIPVAAISAGQVLAIWAKHNKYTLYLTLFAAVCFVSSLLSANKWASLYLYLRLFLIFVFTLILFETKRKIANQQILLSIAFFAATIIYPASYMLYANNNGYAHQKQFIWNYFKNKPYKITVVTNKVQRNLANYYYGFNTQAYQHQYLSFDEATKAQFSPSDSVYVINNWHTQSLSGLNWERLPQYIKNSPPSLVKLYEDPQTIVIWKVTDPSILQNKN